MSVRAKFKVQSINRMQTTIQKPNSTEREIVEMQSIKLTPVYANGDPDHENTKFWQASPSGEITLGTVNLEAGSYFDLGGEYYIDFTKAS